MVKVERWCIDRVGMKKLLQMRAMTTRMVVQYHYHHYLMVLALPVLLAQLTVIHQDHHPNNYNLISFITTTPPILTTPFAYASTIDDLVHQALVKIREADSAGADTSHLVERLNTVISMIRQVEHGNLPESCLSRDECLANAADMLNSIAGDAVTLYKQKVRENTERFYMNILVYAPISALVSSIASTLVYVNLKGYMQARMMEMDVREVKEEE